MQRTLAPTAAPLYWADLCRAAVAPWRDPGVLSKLTVEFQEYFGVRHLFWVTSGKAALALILLGLKRLSPRRKVVIPAYTCFSVPSSVKKAGLDVALCDVDPATLDFNMAELKAALDADVLAVVPTHLLGCHADVAQVRRYAEGKDIFIIEDVAQAFGALKDGKPLGTNGDVSFLSFGRGKNITCGSGGVILTNSDCIAEAVRLEYEQVTSEATSEEVKNWLEVAAMWFLISPFLYWIPAGLPFLKLGETKFYHDFPISRMGKVRAGLLSNWKMRLSLATVGRQGKASDLLRRLKAGYWDCIVPHPQAESVQLRFPLLLKNGEERRRLCALSKEHGLGISHFYPTAIQEIPELRSALSAIRAPGASLLAERLVTLPTHQYVTNQDIKRIMTALEATQYEMNDSTAHTTSGNPISTAGIRPDLSTGKDR
ncbi:MAG: DegT/DnrJ/EryC1/StrS family aminotransferase [Nitrospira sp.]